MIFLSRQKERLFFMHESERLLRLLSDFLARHAACISPDMVADLMNACGVSQEDAFALLLSGCLGLDASGADRAFYARFLRPSVRMLNAADYRENAYLRAVRAPEAQRGAWTLRRMRYQPFEAFVCGNYHETPDGRVLPQIGCFSESFDYPAALENGREWMTVTPNEIETMRAPVERAHGRVLTFGLGLGYFAFMAAQKPSVASVTVVEREEAIIDLFTRLLLPQFPHSEKIRIVRADAFDYARALPDGAFDFAFCDLWHDVSDGLPLYRAMRGILEKKNAPETAYWIEDTLRWY